MRNKKREHIPFDEEYGEKVTGDENTSEGIFLCVLIVIIVAIIAWCVH